MVITSLFSSALFAEVQFFHQFKKNATLYSEPGWTYSNFSKAPENQRPKVSTWANQGQWMKRLAAVERDGKKFYQVELIDKNGNKKKGWVESSSYVGPREKSIPNWVAKEFGLKQEVKKEPVTKAKEKPAVKEVKTELASVAPTRKEQDAPSMLMEMEDPQLNMNNTAGETEAWVMCPDGICPATLTSNRDYYSGYTHALLNAGKWLKSDEELDEYFYAYRKSCKNTEFHKYQNEYKHYVKIASEEFKLPTSFVACIGFRESRWDEKAISPTGPKGLMQFQTNSTATIRSYLAADYKSLLEQEEWDLMKKLTAVDNQSYAKEVGEAIHRKYGSQRTLKQRKRAIKNQLRETRSKLKKVKLAEKTGFHSKNKPTQKKLLSSCPPAKWNTKFCRKHLGTSSNQQKKNYSYIKHIQEVSKSYTTPWLSYWDRVEDLPVYQDNYMEKYMYYQTPTSFSAKVGRKRAPNAIAAGSLYFKHIEFQVVKDKKVEVDTEQKALDYYAVMAAAYNAGEGHVKKRIKGNNPSQWKKQVLNGLSKAKKKEVEHYMEALQNCMRKGNMKSAGSERMCR